MTAKFLGILIIYSAARWGRELKGRGGFIIQMSKLKFKSWEEADEYCRQQDKQEMESALQRGKASDWTFSTEEEATKVGETVWYHPDYKTVTYNGELWGLNSIGIVHGPKVYKSANGKFLVMVTLSNFESRLDRTKMSRRNELGVPIQIV